MRLFEVPFGISPTVISALLHSFLFADLCITVAKNNKWQISAFLTGIALYYFFLIAAFHTSALSFFDIFLACYLLKNVNMTRFMLYKFSVEAAFILLLLFGIVTGSITDVIRQMTWKAGGYYHTLGFSNSNNASLAFWNTAVSLYYIGKKFNSLCIYFTGIIISCLIFKYTMSRTFFLMEALLFSSGLALWFKNSDKRLIKMRPLLLSIPFFALLLLLTFIAIIKNKKYQIAAAALNALFSYRFGYFSEAGDMLTPVNIFFGFKIPETITINGYTKELIIDQSYLRLVFSGGLLTLCIFFYFFTRFMKTENILKNKILIPIVVATAVGGFVESIFCYFDTTALIFWLCLYKGSCRNKGKRSL
jgi:hypothetical protein